MITLRQLRYLAALARTRHFGRAAEDCAVTQPALSMQVRELERDLGVELVERRPGDIALTDIGLEVAQRAERILAAARDIVDFARHRELLSGHLRLGIIPTLAPYLLPSMLPRLQKQHPQLQLEVRETQTNTLLNELSGGELDCVILALPVDASGVETAALFTDPFLLAVPATDKLRGRVDVADVDQRRLILLEEGHCLRDQALAFCAAPLATVMQMVASGYGVTLVPQVAAETEVRDDRVRLLRFTEPQPGRSIGLAWRPTSPRKKDFIALGKIAVAAIKADR